MTQHVELIGHYGSDQTHAQSAWTSTSRDLTPDKQARTSQLLTMLAQDGHHTPFEKSLLHFLIRVDTATHIHLLKHRVGVSVNGESARYKELAEPTYHIPNDWPLGLQEVLATHVLQAERHYHCALAELEAVLGRKRAKESARMFLPYANQLTLDVTFNFRSFMHFTKLRHAQDAQREVRQVAARMLELVAGTGDFDESLQAFGYDLSLLAQEAAV